MYIIKNRIKELMSINLLSGNIHVYLRATKSIALQIKNVNFFVDSYFNYVSLKFHNDITF